MRLAIIFGITCIHQRFLRFLFRAENSVAPPSKRVPGEGIREEYWYWNRWCSAVSWRGQAFAAIMGDRLSLYFNGEFWVAGMTLLYGLPCRSPCCQLEGDDRKTLRVCSCSAQQRRPVMEGDQLSRFQWLYACWFSECRFAQSSPIRRPRCPWILRDERLPT